jgi:hypothetical protein
VRPAPDKKKNHPWLTSSGAKVSNSIAKLEIKYPDSYTD